MPNSNLAIAWYKGCTTPKEKAEREALVRNSVAFSNLLLSILADKFDLVEKKGYKEEDYASTGWMTLQAFRNGKLAQLNEIGELFNHLKP